jgi:fibronectin type 3 domain-containing protein
LLKKLRNWSVTALLVLASIFGWQYVFGAADLTWVAPTQNTDGSALTDLAGFHVYRRLGTAGAYSRIATVDSTSYTDNATLEGLNCYVVTAFDARGNESDYSNEACKLIDTIRPATVTGLTAN